jgi:tRNA(Arg) A34 adenosine deaminase TadA
MGKQVLTALLFDKKGKLLSIGRNNYLKTHPLQAQCARQVGEPERIFLHAEIDALVRLKDWSRAYKIVITRHTKDGLPALAKPCKACLHALSLAGIKHIEHT